MWKCDNCGEQLEDQFASCWRCSGEAGEDVQEFLETYGSESGEVNMPVEGIDDSEDEQLYLDVTNEVDGKNRNKAIWAKSMALSEGDEGKAKYKYINLRVEQEKIKRRKTESSSVNQDRTLRKSPNQDHT